MSALGVSDLLLSDLLKELNLKPWWENLRGYSFAASVVCALFMTYSMLASTPVDCIPTIAENSTTRKPVSITKTNFINTHCFNQLPWYISIYGFSPLLLSLIIVVVSSYWTLFPDVINSFRTFAQFEEIITKVNLPSDQICDQIQQISNTSHIPDTPEGKQIKKACSLLWKFRCPIDIEINYLVRNVALLLVTLASVGISGYLLYCLFVDKSNFKCSLNLEDEFEEPINWTEALCSHTRIKMLQQLMCAFAFFLLGQSVFTAAGFSISCSLKKNLRERDVSINDKRQKYVFFMLVFWAEAKPSDCVGLTKIVFEICTHFPQPLQDSQANGEAPNEGNGLLQVSNQAPNEDNGAAQDPSQAWNESNEQVQVPNQSLDEGNGQVQVPNQARNEDNGATQGPNQAQNERNEQVSVPNKGPFEDNGVTQGPNQALNEGSEQGHVSVQIDNPNEDELLLPPEYIVR